VLTICFDSLFATKSIIKTTNKTLEGGEAMRTVCAKTGFVLSENFIKSSEITTDRTVIFTIFDDDDVYKIFKVVGAYDWERYDRKHYKSITKSLMLFEKGLSIVSISYIEDFTYFVEYIVEDKSGSDVKSLKIIKHMEDYEKVDKLVGYVYVKNDSYIRITDGNEVGKMIEALIKDGWKLKMLA
jgi:hypothetical protein